MIQLLIIICYLAFSLLVYVLSIITYYYLIKNKYEYCYMVNNQQSGKHYHKVPYKFDCLYHLIILPIICFTPFNILHLIWIIVQWWQYPQKYIDKLNNYINDRIIGSE